MIVSRETRNTMIAVIGASYLLAVFSALVPMASPQAVSAKLMAK